jgi:hypothetical protein
MQPMRNKVRRVAVPYAQYCYLSALRTERVKYVLSWTARWQLFGDSVRSQAPRLARRAIIVLAVSLPIAYLVLYLSGIANR